MTTNNQQPSSDLVERGTYQIGIALFNHLHAFLRSVGIEGDARAIKFTITLPSIEQRNQLVESLRQSAPPIGEWRASSAQAGNYGGYWQGFEYEFAAIEATNHTSLLEQIERMREALEKAGDRFAEYAEMHRVKYKYAESQEDYDEIDRKVERNLQYARDCRDAAWVQQTSNERK